jgi:hypothetical protein
VLKRTKLCKREEDLGRGRFMKYHFSVRAIYYGGWYYGYVNRNNRYPLARTLNKGTTRPKFPYRKRFSQNGIVQNFKLISRSQQLG